MTVTSPGWYPDGSGNIRFWDGQQWTAQTQPAGPVSVAPAFVHRIDGGQVYGPGGATNVFVTAPSTQNAMGITGFVLSLVALLFSWIPVFSWVLWILGIVFSAIGIFRQPRGLAIAGLAISLVGVLLTAVVFAGMISFLW